MKVEVNKLPESRVALDVELSPEEVDQSFDRTYRQLVHRVAVPGFRKGKAPRAVVERALGLEVFSQEVMEDAIRWGYKKALDEAKVVPIDEGEISPSNDDAGLRPGESFRFQATVAIRPVVELPDYRSIRVDRNETDVSDEDVDRFLQELRERHVTLEPVVRPAQVGDVLTMNLAGRADGEEVINSENADFELSDEAESGVDVTLPGLSKELIGVNRGDIKEVSLHLPELYARTELAGKTLFVRALIKEIKRKVLPDLNDDFAQTVSELQTLDELREALRTNLGLEHKLQADEKLVNDAMEALSSRTFVEIPPILVEEEIDRMVADLRQAFERRHLNFEVYLQTSGKSEQEIRQEMLESATTNVKTSLIIAALADEEQIEVQQDEVKAALQQIVTEAKMGEKERRRLLSSDVARANIRNRLRRQRALQRLVEIVTGGEVVSTEATAGLADEPTVVVESAEETTPA